MTLRLNGATSGHVEIDAPAVAGSTSITLPATSGGEFVVSDSNGNIDLGPLDIDGNASDDSVNIDSSGHLLVGTTSATNNLRLDQKLAVVSTGTSNLGGAAFVSYAGASTDVGSFLDLSRSKGTTDGDFTAVANGDTLGWLIFRGTDGSQFDIAAFIKGVVDGTPGANDIPGRIEFHTTANGSATERMRIRADGTTVTTGTTILFGGNAATAGTPRSIAFGANEIAWTAGGSGGTNLILNGCDAAGNNGSNYSMYFRGLASGGSAGALLNNFEVQSTLFIATAAYSSTTGNGANVYVGTNGRLYRSVSSAQYKTNIETLEDSYADALLSCRPVWYQSTASDSELHPDWGYWGFIAEEVAEVDPRLVSWKTHEETTALDGTKTVEELAEPIAEGVHYDRFVPHLLNLIKRQKEQIEALEARLTAAGI